MNDLDRLRLAVEDAATRADAALAALGSVTELLGVTLAAQALVLMAILIVWSQRER